MRDTARLFKALSEEPRLEILALMLREGDLCGCEVEAFLGLSQSAASRHLRTLREAGLVEDRREGQWVYYGPPATPSPLVAAVLAVLRERLPAPDVPDLGARLREMRAVRCGTRPEDAGAPA
ncbi:MAG: metalloregulator ArsR/SmtB family transcription factor [Gemmatimonadota bacterium]|nr:metalloregulator ArsR/SmtB family transcription factor [Gemmatimonadota bacterium]